MSALRPGVARRPSRLRISGIGTTLLGIAVLGIVTVLFVTTASQYHIYAFDTFLFACMGAISLQVLQGTGGLISIGNSAFLMIGAFSVVFAKNQGIPFPVDVIGATIFSGICGLIVGVPSLRLRALFLALTTLAAFFLALFVATKYTDHFPVASEIGFQIPQLFASSGLLGADQRWAWLLFIVVAFIMIGASRLMRERSGRALRMIREHEHVAPTLGIVVPRYKLSLFALTAAVIGLQGALYAHFLNVITTDDFTVNLAFQYIAMIVIGGLDSLAGAMIGAAIVIGLPIWLPSWVSPLIGSSKATIDGPNIALVVYGALVVICVTASPNGIVGALKALRRTVSRRFGPMLSAGDELSPAAPDTLH